MLVGVGQRAPHGVQDFACPTQSTGKTSFQMAGVVDESHRVSNFCHQSFIWLNKLEEFKNMSY